jgi:multiple sugar transport system permease protein
MATRRYVEWFWGYLMCAPLLVGVLAFFIGPIIFSFYMSLTNWSSLQPGAFVGLANYVDAFRDARLGREVRNTLYYVVGTVPVSMVLSVLLANALGGKRAGSSIYTTLYFLPNVTMPAAISLVWMWLFNSRYGLINKLLGLAHLPQPVWIADAAWIMPAIMIVSVWMGLGYNVIILIAGLKAIPESYYEASDIDGASDWTKLTRITLPLLSPQIFFLLVMSLIGGFKTFDVVYMFTIQSASYGDLVEASRTMVFGIYEKAFTLYRMGYASMEAVLLFAIIAAATAFQFAAQKRWVHYE